MINRFITKKNHCFYLFGCGTKQNTRKDMAMKNAFTRFLAILLALCLASGGLTSVAAVGTDASPQNAPPAGYDPNVIDYSFDQLADWGYSFALAGNEYRWQTFTATKDGTMEAVEVVLLKKDAVTEAFIDLHAELYAVADGMPTGEPLAVGTTLSGNQVNTAVAGQTVTDDMITRLELTYELEAGKQYAVVLKSSKVTGNGGDTTGEGQCYDWFCGTRNESEYFGKTSGVDPINWVDESGLGTAWMKVYYQRAPMTIDYSFETSANGFGFGATGNEWRWQSFTSNQTAALRSLDLRVAKFNHSGENGLEEIHDLIVAVFATNAEGLPTGDPLVQTTVPAENITSNEPFNVPISCELEEGVRYAVAMTMETPLSLHGGYDCYGWATGSVAAADETGEQFGKTANGSDVNNITENNWVVEDLGTGWMKVNYGEALPPEPEPTTITVKAESSMLEIGGTTELSAVVTDQYGEVMEGQTVTYTSLDETKATVEGSTVTAVGPGVVQIQATCGSATGTVSLSILDEDGKVIPVPGMVITQDTVFKPGVYDFGGAEEGIIIAGSDITVDGTGVVIQNAAPETLLEDVTTGAYAYQLNAADGQQVYMLTRSWDMGSAGTIRLSLDVKADNFSGAMKVYVSENGTDFTQVASKTDVTSEWSTLTADLSAYSGKTVKIRIAYESEGAVPGDLGLKIDTIELFEDGVRTFSDLAESKVYYWWDVSYGDGVRVENGMKNKPFDRTTYAIPTSRFQGVGIQADGVSNVTIKGFTISGFHDAMYITNSSGLVIEDNNLSNNFTDPNGGWGDQLGGAVTLVSVHNSTIRNNIANNNANGLYLKYSNGNTIVNNDFSICSDVCLEMWNSSHNDIRSNNFSWGIRIDAYDEVHARDSTSQLMEAGSNYNYFYDNDFTHGGDGIFIRVGNGWSCEGNVFANNDTSFANNNAVESWAGRNYFIGNKANYSSYGFWMGGTDESSLYYNEVAYNGIMPCNAAERGAGNGGLVYLNGTAEHVELVGNHIHNNNGSGIAIRYDVSKRTDGYVAGHILIQNNIIENTTKGAGEGAAIYLDSVDWVDLSGNKLEGNVIDGVYASPNGKYPVTNVFEHEGTYIADRETYEATAPTAVITVDKTQFTVGEKITFSAADSQSASGNLTYRWSMGDDFGSKATVFTTETVTFSFEKPGYYDVGLTVTDGEWSDIAWVNINVVAEGEEIGTEDSSENWIFGSGVNGGQDDRGGVQEAIIPEVKEWATFKTYYNIDGDHSISVTSHKGVNSLTYPATKDLGADFSQDAALAFSARIHDERNWFSANSPTVKLYTDENNYFTYQANDTFLSPLNFADIQAGQWRTEWVPMYIPYAGDANWTMTRTGEPDLSNINYIEIIAETSGDGTYLWVDGLKSVYTGEVAPVYGPNLSTTGTAVSSEAGEGANASAPVGETINPNAYWVSATGTTSYYGVQYPESRYVNRIELSLLASLNGNSAVALPQDYTVQYLTDGTWKDAANVRRAVNITSGKNTIAFDMVNAEAVRIVFQHSGNSAVALYGFATLNTGNYAAETTFEGKNLTVISSTIDANATLESVELMINVNDQSCWPQDYHDFKVYLSEVSADGSTPVGKALAYGTLTKEEITEGGFGIPYEIQMYTADGGRFVLEAGKRYAVCATQETVNPDKVPGQVAGAHYRWATSSSISAGADEFFGKVDDTNPDNLTGHIEDLGTGWMKVHTDQDRGDKATVDFSWEPLPTAGFGLGHVGEPGRYQTFTATADTVYNMVDGKLDDGKAWVVPGGTESVTFQLASGKVISGVQVWIGDQVPESVKVFLGDDQVAEVTELTQGFNLISFPETTADTIRLEITGAADIYEVEIFQVPEETTDPVDPTDPTDPSEPTDPTDPSQPTDPSNPSEPTDPSEPSDPSNPTETTKPEDTKEPTDPDGPDQTGETFALATVLLLMFMSASAVTILLVLQRRKHNTH